MHPYAYTVLYVRITFTNTRTWDWILETCGPLLGGSEHVLLARDIRSWTRNGESTAESWQPKNKQFFGHWGSDKPVSTQRPVIKAEMMVGVQRSSLAVLCLFYMVLGPPAGQMQNCIQLLPASRVWQKGAGPVGGCCCGDCSNGYQSTMLPLLWLVMLLRLTSWLTWNASTRKRKVNGNRH